MKLGFAGRAAVAGIAVVAALTLSSCSNDDSDSPKKTTTTSAAAAANEPTVPELQALIDKGLDPNVPAAEKENLVQGVEADPELLSKVSQAAAQNQVKVTVLSFVALSDTTGQAAVTAEINGQAVSLPPIDLVYEDGSWKLSKTTACALISTVPEMTSPACTA